MSIRNLLLITGLSPLVNEYEISNILYYYNVLFVKILRNSEKRSYGMACVCINEYLSSKL